MKHNKSLKRFMAFLLCAAMIITYMPSSVYTLADEGSGNAAVASEEAAEAPAEKASKPAPKAEEPKAEEPKAEEPKAEYNHLPSCHSEYFL